MLLIQSHPAVLYLKRISRIDMLTVGLMLIILMAISLPLFHGPAKSGQKQVTGPAAARTAPFKTASVHGAARPATA